MDMLAGGAEHAGDVVILGAGLAGLAAGSLLSDSGADVVIVERERTVGGLARTIEHHGFRFDLGGHRFFTGNKRIEDFVGEAVGGDLLPVRRSSKILLDGAYFDYPLKPLGALGALGLRTAAAALFDYSAEQIRWRFRNGGIESFEDLVVRRFGRTLFDIFIKEYSEKVWGTECDRIAKELAEWRIQGLSFRVAIQDALFRRGGRDARTLAREFLYPPLGIGCVAEGLRRKIETSNVVLTGAEVTRVYHSAGKIDCVLAGRGDRAWLHRARDFVSSIPITTLLRILDPKPPAAVLDAAARLRFRDLVIVTVMIDRPRVTDQSWIYVPRREIPFGRIHEPTNWSERMAPEGKTLLVTEHFCFRGDRIWGASDDSLVKSTVASLESLGFVRGREVLGGLVLRIPGAYPIFEIGHDDALRTIRGYLERFGNLRVTGRGGTFSYFNMDHAIESGIDAAEGIAVGDRAHYRRGRADLVAAEARP